MRESLEALSLFVIFFGGAMSWTIALGHIMETRRRIFNYMFAGFMFCVGTVQFYNGMIIAGKLVEFPHLAFLHLPFLAWTGPTFYFCFKSVIGAHYRLRLVDTLHVLTGLLTFPLLAPFFVMNAERKKAFVMLPPALMNGDPAFLFYSAVVCAVILAVMGYMAFFMKSCSFMLSPRYIRDKKVSPLLVVIVLIIYTIGVLYAASLVATNFVEDPHGFYILILRILSLLSFVLTFFIYIMSRRELNAFQALRKQAEISRYEKSKIRNLDLPLVLGRLEALMKDGKAFLDEDMSLNSLARDLEIEPYQLSQIINERFNRNFNAYINEFRIEEAKRLLLEDGDRTIVSVAYAVGFNNPASFYEWFNKIAGMSPSRFRKGTG